MTVLNTLYTALVVVWGGSELWLSLRRRADTSAHAQDQGSLKALWWTIYISIFVGVFFSFVHLLTLPDAPRHVLFMAGMALILCGLLFRWWSIHVLGRYFTVDVAIASDHRIIRNGPYRWLRHPSYTGALTSFLGLALCQGDLVSMAIIVIPVFAVFLHRIRIEERALAQAFPDDYPRYAQQTARLIPGIW